MRLWAEVKEDGKMDQGGSQLSYVLITPARNEEAFIEKTIESVIHQTVLPAEMGDRGRWIDGQDCRDREPLSWTASVDRAGPRCRSGETAALRPRCRRSTPAMKGSRTCGMKSSATWMPTFPLRRIISSFSCRKFSEDPTPGCGRERSSGKKATVPKATASRGRSTLRASASCSGRQCWEEIGGYIPHRAGGIDWMAVTTARMMGWKTESFREKSFFHYRHLGTAERSVLASSFSYGEKDYYLGGHPVWELFRVAYRATKQPYIVEGLALGLGYCWAFLRRTPRPVSRELMAFHRKEQMAKLKAILKSLVSIQAG